MGYNLALYFFSGAVCAVAVNKDNLSLATHLWYSPDCICDIAALISAGHYHRDRQIFIMFRTRHRSRNNQVYQIEKPKTGQQGKEIVEKNCKRPDALGQHQKRIAAYNIVACEVEQIFDIPRWKPVLIRLGPANSQA